MLIYHTSTAHVRPKAQKMGEQLECGRSFSAAWTRDFRSTIWMAVQVSRRNQTPSTHLKLLEVDTAHLATLEDRLCIDTTNWAQVTLVDHDGSL